MSPYLALSPQINRFGKRRDRALLVTDQHLYKLDPMKQYRVMRAVPLSAVRVPNPARGTEGTRPPPVLCPGQLELGDAQMVWLSCSYPEVEDLSMSL